MPSPTYQQLMASAEWFIIRMNRGKLEKQKKSKDGTNAVEYIY